MVTDLEAGDARADALAHWEHVYATRPPTEVGWFQAEPRTSLRLVETYGGARHSSVVDLGGGAAQLVDRLLDDSWTDLTVVDLSGHALDQVRARIGDAVALVQADVTEWEPARTFHVWHDRAVFHFLFDPAAQAAYVATATGSVEPGGVLVLGVFAPDGPTYCSGLPVRRYDAAELAAIFGPAFVLEHTEREVHVTPAGAEQAYVWVVLRRVGWWPCPPSTPTSTASGSRRCAATEGRAGGPRGSARTR